MKEILLVGGGGHCKSVIDVIETGSDYRIAGIIQPSSDGTAPVLGCPVLGEDKDLPKITKSISNAVVTVGQINTSTLRRHLFDQLKQLGVTLPVLVSPKAYVSTYAGVGEGTVVMHGVVINATAQVGANGIINSMALVEHDAVIGHHCHISTGARVNGGVVIGDGCFIGSGTVLHHGVRIGSNSIIGAGCVISSDIAPNTMVKSNA